MSILWPCRIIAAAAAVAAASAQTKATVPQLVVQYALPGDTSVRKAEAVVIRPPLTLTRNADGKLELALPLTVLTAAGCSVDAGGNMLCSQPGIVAAPPPQSVNVTSEVPQPGTTPGTWTLAHTPADPYHSYCMADGAVQQSGREYTLRGNVITAAWPASAAVTCSYSYLP